jgi:DNA-binding winged helix-turn-helix (wHTH) protein/Tol biopolymer transport system component
MGRTAIVSPMSSPAPPSHGDLPDRDSGPAPTATSITIGDWTLWPDIRRLSRGSQEKRLTRLQQSLLLALLERPNASWERAELIERVWPRRMVADEVLSRAIAQLRQLLEDDAREPRYVETLHGSGYRWLTAPSPPAVEDRGESTRAPSADSLPAPMAASMRRSQRWVWLAVVSIALASALGVVLLTLPGNPAAAVDPFEALAARIARAESFLSTGGLLGRPRLSADGRQLLWLEYAADGGRTALRLARADGTEARSLPLRSAHPRSAAFAADGRSVYFLASDAGICSVQEFVLPDGPERAQGSCRAASLELEVEPDGSLLLTDGAGRLVRRVPGSTSDTPLTTPDCRDCIDAMPRSDGRGAIAFVRGQPGRWGLRLLRPGSVIQLSRGDDRILGLAFDPSSGLLLFSSNAEGSPNLFALDPESGVSRALGVRGAAAVEVGIDGRILIEQRRYQAPLWLQRRGEPALALTRSLRHDSQAALSPDGSKVAFISNRRGPAAVWILDLATREERPLALPEGVWTRPSWSADGTRLWLSRYEAAGPRARAVDVVSARQLPAQAELSEFDRVVELNTRLRVLQQPAEDGSYALWLQEDDRRTKVSASVIAWARADDQLVFQTKAEGALWLLDLRTPDTPAQPLGWSPTQAWTLRADGLLLYEPDAGGQIRLQPLDGAASSVLIEDFGAAPTELRALPEKDAVLFARVERLDIELMEVPAARAPSR